ncbi:MAG TPA: hypothetical protein VGS19_21105 [Streptosporangiaceae bacterium]|nr:hypothetical protein [Streptosporangiaceae bacterium]
MEGTFSAVLLAGAFAVIAIVAIAVAGLLYRVSGSSRTGRPSQPHRPR